MAILTVEGADLDGQPLSVVRAEPIDVPEAA
jgi:hypothetical protein